MKLQVEALFRMFPNRNRDDLIPMLQEVQNQVGYLPPEAIQLVGDHLFISENKVYGVATFYENFRFSPWGYYHFRLCNGTGCHICGTNVLLAELSKQLGINPGQTTKDGLFSLEVVSCMGGCALAPICQVNGHYHANLTKEKLLQLIKTLREKGIDESH